MWNFIKNWSYWQLLNPLINLNITKTRTTRTLTVLWFERLSTQYHLWNILAKQNKTKSIWIYSGPSTLKVEKEDRAKWIKRKPSLWPVWLSWLSLIPQSKRLPFWLSVKAQAWVVGQSSNVARARGNHTLMCLSLSFSLPPPISKNK